MRVLFLVSGGAWSASARAFVIAAGGLSRRGHDVAIACHADCPVHVHAQTANVPIVALRDDAQGATAGWRLREAIRERRLDVIFVHTDAEQFVAGSATRFARAGTGVIRRIPPFAAVSASRRSKLALRLAPTGLLFSTQADREAAGSLATAYRIPAALAPLAVDTATYASIAPANRAAFGAGATDRVIVCIQDGSRPHAALAAIRALSLLAPRHPELRLVIIGSGDLDELRMHGAAVGVNALVSYLGVRDDDLSIIRAADVGWLAASGDAAALGALDCMALGVPVIAERTPLSEHYVADGIAGVLLAGMDATETASSIAAFLTKGDQRAQMGHAARSRLQRDFAFDTMMAGYEEAMRAATGTRARP